MRRPFVILVFGLFALVPLLPAAAADHLLCRVRWYDECLEHVEPKVTGPGEDFDEPICFIFGRTVICSDEVLPPLPGEDDLPVDPDDPPGQDDLPVDPDDPPGQDDLPVDPDNLTQPLPPPLGNGTLPVDPDNLTQPLPPPLGNGTLPVDPDDLPVDPDNFTQPLPPPLGNGTLPVDPDDLPVPGEDDLPIDPQQLTEPLPPPLGNGTLPVDPDDLPVDPDDVPTPGPIPWPEPGMIPEVPKIPGIGIPPGLPFPLPVGPIDDLLPQESPVSIPIGRCLQAQYDLVRQAVCIVLAPLYTVQQVRDMLDV